MKYLHEKLEELRKSDYYPFHMPGHKRRFGEAENTYSIDITEINGFDDLHCPKDIISDLEAEATELYKTVKTKLLVNGSTSGLMAAISATCKKNGKILIARNCHKSVYNTIELLDLVPIYLYPETDSGYGINCSIKPDAVKAVLDGHEDIQAVLITSPTYDGVMSDIHAISNIVHEKNIPLIVDEAHGAHLPFTAGLFPKSALLCGADIVIHSLHKTLPSLTQTALLHINSELVSTEKVKKYLSVYQSSSPSYILMASISRCIKWLKEEGRSAFEKYEKEVLYYRNCYREVLEGNNSFSLLDGKNMDNVFDYDISKIILCTKNKKCMGKKLYDIFQDEYHLQLEMAAYSYVLALSSVCDSKDGFERLLVAIKEVSEKYFDSSVRGEVLPLESIPAYPKPLQYYTPGEAIEKDVKKVSIEESEGLVSGTTVFIYPPGIPFLVPGEQISSQVISYVDKMKNSGLEIIGLEEDNQILAIIG